MLINNAFTEKSIRLDTCKTVAEKQLAPEFTVSKLVHNVKNQKPHKITDSILTLVPYPDLFT